MNKLDSIISKMKENKAKSSNVTVTLRIPERLVDYVAEFESLSELTRQEFILDAFEIGLSAIREKMEKTSDAGALIGERDNLRFHILNTSKANGDEHQEFMLANKAAAAFSAGWKECIEKKIKADDIVFLYQNKVGIIACGQADGITQKTDFYGIPEECWYQKLQNFKQLTTPFSAAEVREALQRNIFFGRTLVSLSDGEKIINAINKKHAELNIDFLY